MSRGAFLGGKRGVMREYAAYSLILIIVVGIALAWRASRTHQRRNYRSTRYQINSPDDGDKSDS